jgi:hypothetical protein
LISGYAWTRSSRWRSGLASEASVWIAETKRSAASANFPLTNAMSKIYPKFRGTYGGNSRMRYIEKDGI